MTTIVELHEQIAAAGVPIDGVSLKGNTIRIDYQPAATPQQITAAQGLANTWLLQTPQQRKTSNRAAIITAAQALNGTPLTSLNAVQQRQMLALLLYKAGWVASDLTISIPAFNE